MSALLVSEVSTRRDYWRNTAVTPTKIQSSWRRIFVDRSYHIGPFLERRKDRLRLRQSSSSVMNAGDQACPETRPCPRPSPGGRKPARTLARKVDGTDVLLGNVEFQHCHAAQLNTHANGSAERWVGNCRRDLLDHVIAVNERHLKRLLTNYVTYYHEDRTHLGLNKGTLNARVPAVARGRVVGEPRLGGLHHRYDRAA